MRTDETAAIASAVNHVRNLQDEMRILRGKFGDAQAWAIQLLQQHFKDIGKECGQVVVVKETGFSIIRLHKGEDGIYSISWDDVKSD